MWWYRGVIEARWQRGAVWRHLEVVAEICQIQSTDSTTAMQCSGKKHEYIKLILPGF